MISNLSPFLYDFSENIIFLSWFIIVYILYIRDKKLVLKDNCDAENDLTHNIDLKLKGNLVYEADIYKTVIKFEAEQK